MAAQTLYNEIDLESSNYTSVSLSNNHSFYLIAVAQNDEISSITFSIAIDSGVKNNLLNIQNITLPVKEGISGVRFDRFPDSFYIKPLQVILKNDTVMKHNIDNTPFDVEINISPLNLG